MGKEGFKTLTLRNPRPTKKRGVRVRVLNPLRENNERERGEEGGRQRRMHVYVRVKTNKQVNQLKQCKAKQHWANESQSF